MDLRSDLYYQQAVTSVLQQYKGSSPFRPIVDTTTLTSSSPPLDTSSTNIDTNIISGSNCGSAGTLGYSYQSGGGGGGGVSSSDLDHHHHQQQLAVAAAAAAAVKSAALKMDLTTAYRYNQNMMEYYTCKSKHNHMGLPVYKTLSD